VEKRRVLYELGVNEDQFLDMGLLAGFDYLSTFPPLVEVPGGFTFRCKHYFGIHWI
jgi:hypothetical protein